MQTFVKHHMPKAKKATAALGSQAPQPLGPVDPLVRERTRFSPDRTHRFTLFRHWGDVEDYACGISMNPSGATEEDGDQTVDGMCDRARNYWGVGAYYQLNVMSIRGTYSNQLGTAQTLSLPENDKWIREIAPKARFVVVSWGRTGHMSGRGTEVEKILREVCDPDKVLCFAKNKNGSPTHPLYISRNAPLIPFFS